MSYIHCKTKRDNHQVTKIIRVTPEWKKSSENKKKNLKVIKSKQVAITVDTEFADS